MHQKRKLVNGEKTIFSIESEAEYNKPISIGDIVVDEYGVPGMVIEHSPAYPHALDYIVEWYDGEEAEPDAHRASEEKIKKWRDAARKLKESLKERIP